MALRSCRLNDRILKSERRLVDFTGEQSAADGAAEFSQLTPRDMSASIGGRLKYAARPGASVRLRSLTYWIVADLETEPGRQLLHDALLQAVRTGGGGDTHIPPGDGARPSAAA